ncbi:S53 family peptidase [Microlunatus flavus]|uniref:Subtilase family protein n=1 Tax=Microlunatus flavus TaxID=1036181 RepID=A0A1H9F661_9ACTN|nr:S53 family peptidase [Microlunatus flavus]SEQ33365.1 Subtilase family protein [Microlunatus flavus]
MQHRSRRTRLIVAASTLLVPAALLATVQTADAAPAAGSVAIPSTLPSWLPKATSRARTAAPAAAADASQTVRVYLAPNGGSDALAKAALAVSDPSSASYGQFLTADQFHAQWSPTAQAEQTVRGYLADQGLTVSGTAPFRRYVTATGTVSQLDKAFGVTLKKFTHDGQHVVAPTGAARVPAKVGAAVLTVSGLDTTQTKMVHKDTPKATTPPAGFRNGRPCSTFWGDVQAKYQADFKTPLPKFDGSTLTYAPCGYTGPQLRAAYEGGTNLDGSGATIAITDAYAWQYIASDANRYASENGDGSYAAGQLTQNLPASFNSQDLCDPTGWSGEETLDVEAAHAMAPGAKIRYYGSSSCLDDDFLDTLARVADEGVAQVVSNSWGDAGEVGTADSYAAYGAVLQQSALQGISVLFSSGDSGDELANTGIKSPDYPASDPYVTAVGGTATAINRSGVRLDTGWGTRSYALSADGKSWTGGDYLYGAGGGVSNVFNQPAYQRGVVNTRLSGGRAVPDLAMDADPQTGMLIGQTQTFPDGTYYAQYRIGGTSLASPLMAGMTALAVQHNQGRGFGLLNPLIYKQTKVFDDVVPHSNLKATVRVNYNNGVNNDEGVSYIVRTFDQDSSLKTTTGWDQVTGRGVPRPSFFKLTTPSPATAAVKR